MVYNPGRLGDVQNLEELRRFLEDELDKISKQFNETTALDLRTVNVEPEKPREGMLASADGTNWDPGAGKGTYEFINGVWQRVGGVQDGDYGEITVAGGNWTIDNGVVVNAKLADMAQTRVKGRANAAGTGVPTDLTPDQIWAIIQQASALGMPFGKMNIGSTPSSPQSAAWSMVLPTLATTLSGNVSFDLETNSLRCYENGGAFRGWQIDLSKCSSGLGTNLLNQMDLVNAVGASPSASVLFQNIPVSKGILVAFGNLSHNNGAVQTLVVNVSSDNGSSFSGDMTISSSLANGVLANGFFLVLNADTTGTGIPVVTGQATALGGLVTSINGPINAVRLRWSAGNFDNGSIYVYRWR